MSNFLGPNGHILYFPILVCALRVLFKNVKDGGCAREDRGDTGDSGPIYGPGSTSILLQHKNKHFLGFRPDA